MSSGTNARQQMDALIAQAGWEVQGGEALGRGAGRGRAISEFPLSTVPTDELFVLDRQAIGQESSISAT